MQSLKESVKNLIFTSPSSIATLTQTDTPTATLAQTDTPTATLAQKGTPTTYLAAQETRVIDLRAINHMTCTSGLLSDLEHPNNLPHVTLANGLTTTISGLDNVNLSLTLSFFDWHRVSSAFCSD
jgi:hypothetical protein